MVGAERAKRCKVKVPDWDSNRLRNVSEVNVKTLSMTSRFYVIIRSHWSEVLYGYIIWFKLLKDYSIFSVEN